MTDPDTDSDADANGDSDSDADTAASLAERVRAGDLSLHELEDHADADVAATARRLLVEEQ